MTSLNLVFELLTIRMRKNDYILKSRSLIIGVNDLGETVQKYFAKTNNGRYYKHSYNSIRSNTQSFICWLIKKVYIKCHLQVVLTAYFHFLPLFVVQFWKNVNAYWCTILVNVFTQYRCKRQWECRLHYRAKCQIRDDDIEYGIVSILITCFLN